ncbi:FMN-binding protein [Cetobacterium sp.]|uniref:FMN-binding protein n=1 Tax=Cetobacterium sp. TaxID=2071632 RepID=UPI003F389F8D
MVKEGIRKKSVIAFVVIGLLLGIYESKKPGPIVVEGSGTGYNDELNVKLKAKLKGDKFKIVEVDIIHEDTPPIADPAVENLKQQILKKQNSDLDIIAGATYTSKGVKEATVDAIKKIKK